MNLQLRERLGQAAFEQSSFVEKSVTWGSVDEQVREEYRNIAETVAIELAQVTLPALQGLAFAFTC
jgi:hypothetical protein